MMSFAFEHHAKWRKLEPFLLGLLAYLEDEKVKLQTAFDIIARFLTRWNGRFTYYIHELDEEFPMPKYPKILIEANVALKEAGYLKQADELMDVFINDYSCEYATYQYVKILLTELTP